VATTAGKTAPTYASAIGPGESNLYIVNPMEVRKHRADLLVSLNHIFGTADWARSETEKAAGDGLAYLAALRERARKASLLDVTAITAKFESVKRSGVLGGLKLDTLDTFLEQYEEALVCLPPTERPADSAEAQMISTIALRDPDVRELYELKHSTAPPSNREEAVAMLKGILRGRLRHEEIDQFITGAPGTALQTYAAPAPAAVSAPVDPNIASLTAAVAKLAATVDKMKKPKEDPNKNTVAAPRNADGSVKKWIEGMAACKYCGEKHLQAKRKVEYESIFMYGMRWLASAKLDFKPAFVGAGAQSNDMIRMTRVPQLMNEAVVCVVKYPFSRVTSDAIDTMLDQGQFKLINDHTGSAREIYVAGTLKELQKMLAMKLMRDDDSSSDSSDDGEPLCLDVTPGGEPTPAARCEWRLERCTHGTHPRAARDTGFRGAVVSARH
jgi:hypothetical protein